MDLVVLSPHLDDAVFSVGGTIAETTARGEEACVVTFFTDGPPLDSVSEEFRVFADYESRRAEDEAALRELGASHRWLGYVERAFREPRLPRPRNVFATPSGLDEFTNLASMRDAIRGLLDEFPGAQFLAPLGVGNHFDHAEVFVASALEKTSDDPGGRFSFYEDVYAMGTRMRKNHFVARRRGWGLWSGPDAASVKLYAMMRVMAGFRGGPAIETYVPALADRDWSVERMAVGEEAGARQWAAVQAYPSQLEALGGDVWRAALRRYHEWWDGAEPRWQLV